MTAPAKRMKRSEVPFDTRMPFELGEKAGHLDPRSRSASPPLTPVDWRVTYDGETISLDPSIGNWSLDCRSHYWIRRGRVEWAPAWSDEKIAEGRSQHRGLRARFFRLSESEESEEAVGGLIGRGG
jgi:hypothetical protein